MAGAVEAGGGRAGAALLADLRHDMAGRARAISGQADLLVAEVRRCDLPDLLPDLAKVQTASRHLIDLIDAMTDAASGEAADESFRARLRHDLRTPINAIKGYGEMLLEDAAADGLERLAAPLRQVLAEVEALQTVIDVCLRGEAAAGETDPPIADPVPLVRVAPLSTGHVLVVDDNERNRDVLRRRLERDGHRVTTAEDGAAALERVRSQAFDLILLDMIMPGLSGLEVLTALKWDEKLSRIPVIMVSALDEIGGIVRCIEMGAEDYLSKPFNPVLLRARIGACLEKKRLRDIERVFLDNIERELAIARQIQRSILPRGFPVLPLLSGHGLMVPAREVGGDFYDFIRLDEHRLGIAVADVSGKGVPAAFFMAIVRTLLRNTALFGLSPGPCLEKVNDQLAAENDHDMFVTLFYGIVDCAAATFTYANGGHNWPALVRADGTVSWLAGTDDMLVGIIEGNRYREKTVALAPEDFVFLYTDGVVEAFDIDGVEFGSPRLAAVLAEHGRKPAAAATEAVLEAVKEFERGVAQADDVTCVGFRYRGA